MSDIKSMRLDYYKKIQKIFIEFEDSNEYKNMKNFFKYKYQENSSIDNKILNIISDYQSNMDKQDVYFNLEKIKSLEINGFYHGIIKYLFSKVLSNCAIILNQLDSKIEDNQEMQLIKWSIKFPLDRYDYLLVPIIDNYAVDYYDNSILKTSYINRYGSLGLYYNNIVNNVNNIYIMLYDLIMDQIVRNNQADYIINDYHINIKLEDDKPVLYLQFLITNNKYIAKQKRQSLYDFKLP